MNELPHNGEAEAAYLSAALLDNAVLDNEPLHGDDFYKVSWRLVHESMLALRKEGVAVDIVTLCQKMQTAGTLDKAGGIAAVTSLNDKAPSAKLANSYAAIIRGEAQKRAAVKIGEVLRKAAEKGDDITAALIDAQTGLNNLLLSQTNHEKTKADRLADFSSWVEERAKKNGLPGIPTGNQDLDRLTLGWQDGDLVILAARPGMGKTALALNFLHDAAARGCQCKFFSLEMPSEQIFARLAAMEKGLTSEKLMNPALMGDEDWAAFIDASMEIERLPLDVDDTRRAYTDISRQIRRDVSNGARLIIIDYLQLIHGERRENRTQEISAISNDMKRLAVEMRVPIICLSQLSRAVESRNDKRPMLSDLRESGSIEQDADVVLFLYRDAYYHENTDKPWAELEIAKQRKGRGQGRVKMFWYPEKMRFHALSRIDERSFGTPTKKVAI